MRVKVIRRDCGTISCPICDSILGNIYETEENPSGIAYKLIVPGRGYIYAKKHNCIVIPEDAGLHLKIEFPNQEGGVMEK